MIHCLKCILSFYPLVLCVSVFHHCSPKPWSDCPYFTLWTSFCLLPLVKFLLFKNVPETARIFYKNSFQHLPPRATIHFYTCPKKLNGLNLPMRVNNNPLIGITCGCFAVYGCWRPRAMPSWTKTDTQEAPLKASVATTYYPRLKLPPG